MTAVHLSRLETKIMSKNGNGNRWSQRYCVCTEIADHYPWNSIVLKRNGCIIPLETVLDMVSLTMKQTLFCLREYTDNERSNSVSDRISTVSCLIAVGMSAVNMEYRWDDKHWPCGIPFVCNILSLTFRPEIIWTYSCLSWYIYPEAMLFIRKHIFTADMPTAIKHETVDIRTQCIVYADDLLCCHSVE